MANNKGIDITKRRSFVFSDLCRRITFKSITNFIRLSNVKGISKKAKKRGFLIYTNKQQLIGNILNQGRISVRVIYSEGVTMKKSKLFSRNRTMTSSKFVYRVEPLIRK